jgi:hypothetical protein
MSDNLPAVNAALNALLDRIDAGANRATNYISAELERLATANASEAKHPQGTRRQTQTVGPQVVTGNLINNIRAQPAIRVGFGTYIGSVDSGAIYSRALEEGNPKWRSNVKYPYMTPAYNSIIQSGRAEQLAVLAISSAIRG